MLGQEASELVEPEGAVDGRGWGGYEHGRFVCEGDGERGIGRGAGLLVVKGFEVLL